MSWLRLAGAALAATMMLGAHAASASLPGATGYVSCQSSSGTTTDPVSCTGDGASGTRTLGPIPGLTSYASFPGGGAYVPTPSVFGVLTYYFTVTGGNPGDAVPLDFVVDLHAAITEAGYAFSSISIDSGGDIYRPDNQFYKVICSDPICTDQSTDFHEIVSLTAYVGIVGTVSMEVESATNSTNDPDVGVASADPFIYVDPQFANAADYGIELSPGVGGVPEPATWAMLVAGFGLAGAALRRRRPADLLACA